MSPIRLSCNIVEGCLQAKVALIGGETAEMPGMYSGRKIRCGHFAVGEVDAIRCTGWL